MQHNINQNVNMVNDDDDAAADDDDENDDHNDIDYIQIGNYSNALLKMRANLTEHFLMLSPRYKELWKADFATLAPG